MEQETTSPSSNKWLSPLAIGAYLAALKLLIHFIFNSNYGYFRDELYFLACAEHLSWGYPDHSPMVAIMAKASRVLLGDSLFAIRFFPAVAGAFKVFLTALLVKEFGGKRFATFLACLCVICAPTYLAIDNLLSMNSLEPVFWMLCVYFAIRATKETRSEERGTLNENQTQHSALSTQHSYNWLFFGLFAGLGLMNKHSMIFFGASIVAGLLLTNKRKVFLDKYFWLGGVIAFLIFLPNIIWQIQNDFATLELLRNVQATGKNVEMSPLGFFISQIMGLLPLTFPLWIVGIYFFLFDKNGAKFRFLGIAYIVLFAMMIYLKAKDYYLIPVYPMLFAGGAVFWEQLIEKIRALRFLKYVYPVLILGLAIIVAPVVMPILPVETLIAYQKAIGYKPPKTEVSHDAPIQQIFGDQFGWQDLAEKTAEVYNSLPPEERAKAGILAGNYGEAGAIDFFGGRYGLPKAISGHQSYFIWGPRDYTGEVLIVLGARKEEAEKRCESVEEKTEINHPYSPSYEKYKILVCRKTRKPLPEIWQQLKFWN
jgi:Dolichyl-phosphate-mannose-protein mannosyltransferase